MSSTSASAKHWWAQVGTALIARWGQSVAVAVTVEVTRGGRMVVVVAVTPRQLQAEAYSSRSSQAAA
ncbi:hypothetical protein VTK73DRAFT_8162 [Phialemonium thermophilum]|uniref:Uncharacterized protein n=1 Tax=Phialemonium thermophilum TaxID=223376 RepID=A0ABR3WA72_9PEZI